MNRLKKIITISVLGLIVSVKVPAQESLTLYIVKDAITLNPVSDCTISYVDGKRKTHHLTSTDGKFYPEKKDVTVSISHIGYETKIVALSQVVHNTIYLTAKSIQLGEVTVYSAFSPTNKGSSYRYNALQAGSSISVIGEPDVLRHISSLPGVSQGIESSLGLFVRGGNNGSSGIRFNDIPMYVSSHLMGMFSVFPAEMTDETTFYMGGLPAAQGNLSSSLLDISVKRKFGAKFDGKLSLSPYLSGIYASVPLIKNKLSVQVSGRTSFAPYLINWFYTSDEKMNIQIFDIISTIDYKISEKHAVEAMFFKTNDYIDDTQNRREFAQNWHSTAGKLGWKYAISNKLKLNVFTHYTQAYSAQKEVIYDKGNDIQSQLGVSSGLDEWEMNAKINSIFSNKFALNAGISYQNQLFKPGNEKYVIASSDVNHIQENPNNLLSFFAEANYNQNKYINLRLGYRYTHQKTEADTYSNYDVHVLNHLFLNDDWGIELAFDRMNQYYHVLEGLPTGWSLNIMTPSSEMFPAELTYQYYSGLFWKRDMSDRTLRISLGGYYRDMKNIVTYINAINAFGFESSSWEEEIDTGRGTSYGLEMSGSLQGSRFGSTLAYTLSKTDRTYPNVNDGKPFPFKFDRRHILNLQTKFTASEYTNRKGKRIEHIINSVLAYSSGNRATLPISTYQGEAPPYWEYLSPGMLFPTEFYDNIYDRQLMSDKNSIRLKDYFRIDVAYTLKRTGKKVTNEFIFSVFNVLNRHNPYTYFYENGEWKQLSIIPIMPSVRWALSW
ncbi:MAG: hypothetical protein ACK5KP_08430 [Paludibacteraceae bacterium]